MAPRPRIRKRSNFPDNMYEPREGYYTWRDPRDGKTHILGRIPLAQAVYEAQEANLVLTESAKRRSLAERLSGPESTVADLLRKMPTQDLAANTIASYKQLDRIISNAIGQKNIRDVTTRDVSNVIEAAKARGTMSIASMLRGRLVSAFKAAMSLGWTDTNPASHTSGVKVKVQRARLSLDEFLAIHKKAPAVNEWLQNAMMLALVSGQDRATIASVRQDSVRDGALDIKRPKTGVWIRIPVELRMDCVGKSLADVISECCGTGVKSEYLIHEPKKKGEYKAGRQVSLAAISKAFAAARRLADITPQSPPTFHEIRSLSKRLYMEQGSVDTKSLLGHLTESVANLYANSRGSAPIVVKVR